MCGAFAASSAIMIGPQDVSSVIVYFAAVSIVSFGSALKVRVAWTSVRFRRAAGRRRDGARRGAGDSPSRWGSLTRWAGRRSPNLLLPLPLDGDGDADADGREHEHAGQHRRHDLAAPGALLLALGAAGGPGAGELLFTDDDGTRAWCHGKVCAP